MGSLTMSLVSAGGFFQVEILFSAFLLKSKCWQCINPPGQSSPRYAQITDLKYIFGLEIALKAGDDAQKISTPIPGIFCSKWRLALAFGYAKGCPLNFAPIPRFYFPTPSDLCRSLKVLFDGFRAYFKGFWLSPVRICGAAGRIRCACVL